MAHVQKFTRGAVGGLSTHIERKTENHSNKDIDRERTHENYDLCEKEGDMLSRYQERLDGVHCLNRADVKVMADWVLTLPEELNEAPESSKKRFFEESYDFMSDRYGEENVLSGVVHNDETTPHMHFAFIPVTFDEKKQREKVSAKEVLDRKDLKGFHQDLDKHLKERIPQIYQKGILNNKTIGIDDVATLKEKSKEIERLSEGMDNELSKKKTRIFDMESNLEKKKSALEIEIKKVNNIEGKLKHVSYSKNYLDDFEKNLSRTITGKRILTSKDFDELKKFVAGVQKSGIKNISTVENLENENLDLSKDLRKTSEKLDSVSRHKEDLLHENRNLESKIERLKSKNNVLESDLIVSNSKLLEKGYDFSKMPEIESKGRLVIDRLENGYEPKNKKVANNWKDILEENSEKKLISSEQLNNAMQELKKIIQKMIDKVKDIGLPL